MRRATLTRVRPADAKLKSRDGVVRKSVRYSVLVRTQLSAPATEERRQCTSTPRRRGCRPRFLDLPPPEKLGPVRQSFSEGGSAASAKRLNTSTFNVQHPTSNVQPSTSCGAPIKAIRLSARRRACVWRVFRFRLHPSSFILSTTAPPHFAHAEQMRSATNRTPTARPCIKPYPLLLSLPCVTRPANTRGIA
jgi:hypothetical protein